VQVLFDEVTAAAEAGAMTGAQTFHTPTDFDGTNVAPSEGYMPPVLPATKTLYPHQMAAVESILTKQPRCLLGYAPGLGKTAILSTVAAAKVVEGHRVLIVVPPALRVSPWLQEMALDFPNLLIDSPVGKKRADIMPNAEVVIIGDSILTDRLADIQKWNPTAILVDEAHRMKNRKAKRSIALLTLADALPQDAVVVCATGTLADNKVTDVYQPLRVTGAGNAIAVSRGASYTRFMDEWCLTNVIFNGRNQVRVAVGCNDVEGLRNTLTSTCMLSVPREEVLDLPDRTFMVRSLTLTNEAREYKRVEKEFLSWIREVKGDAAYKRACKAEAITKMNSLFEHDGIAKVKPAAEYIDAIVEQGEPVVVFTHHRSVANALYHQLLKMKHTRVRSLVGGMTAYERADVVDDFQAGNIDILIASITSAGVGITLTRSCNAVFLQSHWSPGVVGQASDRVYRIGATRPVNIHVLNGLGMMSETLWNVLQDKAGICDGINHGRASTIDPENIQEAVLEAFGW
jgi:SNF2 family DNA or RNA helicase